MKIAIYPGTFDPPTNGHLDLISRASKMFDRVIVAIGINAEKHPIFSDEERTSLLGKLTEKMENVSVDKYDGLLVEFARRQNAETIVRGIRTVSDFEYEFQMALMNRTIAPDIETVFIMPAEEFSFVSSTLVKQAVGMGADMTKLIPKLAHDAMRKKLQARRQTEADS